MSISSRREWGQEGGLFAPSIPGFSDVALEIETRLADTFRHWSATETYRRSTRQFEFAQLAQEWKTDTADESSPTRVAMHPSYQRIIGMGPAALPFILSDLESTQDDWFWALRAITGEDPVAPEDRGYLERMVRSWVRWGMRNGII
jgi:hypothetical protein